MCGQCRGLSRVPDWYVHVLGEGLRDRHLARFALAETATRALEGMRVSVVSPPGSVEYSVRDTTGRSIAATSVDEIIDAAERLAGRRFDPLAAEQWDVPL